jgi:hypothetical protein
VNRLVVVDVDGAAVVELSGLARSLIAAHLDELVRSAAVWRTAGLDGPPADVLAVLALLRGSNRVIAGQTASIFPVRSSVPHGGGQVESGLLIGRNEVCELLGGISASTFQRRWRSRLVPVDAGGRQYRRADVMKMIEIEEVADGPA